MTNNSKHHEIEESIPTPVTAEKWWPDSTGHEKGDQIRVGTEKVIADLPEPTGMTLMLMQDGHADLPPDVALRERLRGRVDKMETCGNDAMAREVRHMSCGRPNAYMPVRVFFCHEPGCPNCWSRRVDDDLYTHRDRLDVAYGDGYRILRLDAPTGWGPERTRDAVDRMLRRRTVKRDLKPFAGTWLPVIVDDEARYSITLIVPTDFPTDTVAGLWSELTGGQAIVMDQPMYEADAATMEFHRMIGDFDELADEGEWDTHPIGASVTLHDLKVAADQAIPLLVTSGHLGPATAATWMVEETNRRKLKFGGGFQDVAPAVMRGNAHDEWDMDDDSADRSERSSYYDDDEFDEMLFDDACHDSPRELNLELGETGHGEEDDPRERPPIPCPYDSDCALTFTGHVVDTETLADMGYEMTEFPDGLKLWERKERSRQRTG